MIVSGKRVTQCAWLTLALFFVLAIPARATILTTSAGAPVGGFYQSWASHMLTRSVPTVVMVPFHPLCDDVEPSGAIACEVPGEVAVDPTQPGVIQQFGLLHELGHQFDEDYFTDTDRVWVRAILGYAPGFPWTEGWGVRDAFANDYAVCAMARYTFPAAPKGSSFTFSEGPYGSTTVAGQRQMLANLCAFVDLVGADSGALPPASAAVGATVAHAHRLITEKRKTR